MEVTMETVLAQVAADSNLKQRGADEERARIVAYLRKDAENSTEAETLNDYATYIAAGFHWDEDEDDLHQPPQAQS